MNVLRHPPGRSPGEARDSPVLTVVYLNRSPGQRFQSRMDGSRLVPVPVKESPVYFPHPRTPRVPTQMFHVH